MEKIKNRLNIYEEMYASFFERIRLLKEQEEGDWCCLAIHIPDFKLFNFVYGSEPANKALNQISEYLKEGEKKWDAVSEYFGRDSFALFMRYEEDTFERIGRELESYIRKNNCRDFLPVIGVYRLKEESPVDMTMFEKALSAVHGIKREAKKRVIFYDESRFEQEKEDFLMMLRLQKAITDGEVSFYLQPQCRISTGRVVGAEALVRWFDSDGKILLPGKLIGVLEKYGYIFELDKYVWEQVFKWVRSLLDRSIIPVPISVNISQKDISAIDVPAFFCELSEKYQVPPHLIKAEITESSYAKALEDVQDVVAKLREKGFLTMMDDFGSGYSSLTMLENINVDVLKLDMIFMREQNLHSRKGITIIENIVNMSKMMGMPIVVEGVETTEQVDFLKSLGCRYAQGYYFYRPMPIGQFEELIADKENMDYRGFISKMNEQFHVREFLDENMFTDTMLNNVLGAVAFYTLDGKDLTINRFNAQFYRAIGDGAMEQRQVCIQNYVVREDWPKLYNALEKAANDRPNGGTCEIRFYKSDNSVFWFHMHFFYLKSDQQKQFFYGKVEDVTERKEQSLQFFEVLREQADITMRLDLDREIIQYINRGNTLSQIGLPSVELSVSIPRTAENRIDDEEDKARFMEFFNVERLKNAYRRAQYHEEIAVGFRFGETSEQVVFSTYYIGYSGDQGMIVYVFAKRV